MGLERQVLSTAVKNNEGLVCTGVLCWSINKSKPEGRISLEEQCACVEESTTCMASHRRDCLGTLVWELIIVA